MRADPRSGPIQTGTTAAKPIPDASERRVFLAGTALVSTLMLPRRRPPRPRWRCSGHCRRSPSPSRTHSDCIFPGTCALISTILPGASIDFTNSGDFATVGIFNSTIFTLTNFGFSSIDVTNSGDLATAGFGAIGINATTLAGAAPSASPTVAISPRSVSSPTASTVTREATAAAYRSPIAAALPPEATMPGALSATPLAETAISRSPIAGRSPRAGFSPMASTPTREAATATSPSRTAAKSRRQARTPTASAPLPIAAAARSASSIAGISGRQGFWPAASSARPMAQAARSKSTTAAARVARA